MSVACLSSAQADTQGNTQADTRADEAFRLEMNQAILNADTIKSARQAYLSARENIIIANQPKEWSATLSGTHKYADTAINGADHESNNNAEVAVTLRRKIFDGGLSSAQEESAHLSLGIAQAQVDMAEEDFLLAAIRAYAERIATRDQFNISTSNVERLKEHVKAAEIQLEVGESTQTERAGTYARLARAEANLIQAHTALANAEASYRSLTGEQERNREDTALPSLAPDLPNTASDAVNQALKNKASLKIAQLSERIARKNIDVLTAQVRPNLNLSLEGKSNENTLDQRDSEEFSASVTLTMPLYPSASVRAKSRGIVADHRQALFRLEDQRRATRLAAENAFRLFKASQAVIRAYEAERDAAISVRYGTTQEVEFGEKTILDQLDAEQDVVAAELNLLEARRDLVNASYVLKAAIGELTAGALGLEGLGVLADEPPIESPIGGIYPTVNYPE